MADEDPQVLLFMHIPKTGGTTLRQILERIYPQRETVRIYKERTADPEGYLRRILEEDERCVSLVEGHFAFGLHEVLPRPSAYLTMVRDPVERVLSQYHSLRRYENHPLHDQARSMSFREYVSEPITWEVDNGQVRFLSGDTPAPHEGEFDDLEERHLRDAKRVVDEEDVIVGVTDRFDLSILLAADRLGWSTPNYVRRNVGSERPAVEDLPAETLELIEERNRLDMELYQHARKRLEEAAEEAGIEDEALREFHRSNERYRLVYPVLHAPADLVRRAIWQIRR